MAQKGHIHPLNHIILRSAEIFAELGFAVVSGPEIETEYYNFDALNIPQDHPARESQDTFWLSDGNLLWNTVPTLDGLGPSGDNDHCSERSADGTKVPEYILVDSIAPKALLNVLALQRLITSAGSPRYAYL